MMQKLVTGLCGILLAVATPAVSAKPQENQGHHQSGIVGSVSGGVIIATPNGAGSGIRPDLVRVFDADFPDRLVAEVETEVQGDVLWHFEVYLKPGRYLLVAYTTPLSDDGPQSFSHPVPVTVEKHQFTEVPPLSFVPQ